MNPDNIFAANSLVYPLTALLVSLFILKRVKDDLRPIVTNVVGSLAEQSKRNALSWTLGFLAATLASLQAMQEVATAQGWIYIAAACKVLQPGLTVIIMQGRSSSSDRKPTGTTTPPFDTTKP